MTKRACPRGLGALAIAAAGCQLPLDEAACPCAPGWVCCAASNICVLGSADRCPGDHDAGGDAPDDAADAPAGAGVQRLQPEHGWVGDAFGAGVAAADDLVAVGVPGRDVARNNDGAVVVYQRRGGEPGVWVRIAVLSAPEPVDNGSFGSAVAFADQGVLLVGAPGVADRAGRVYLFQRAAGGWSWQQTIEPDLTGVPADRVNQVQFGNSISVDGHRAIFPVGVAADLYDIGAAGAARIARLHPAGEPANGIGSTLAAVHGSSAAVVLRASTVQIDVFDEAQGWAAPALVADALTAASPLAYDGQRLAISPGSKTNLVRIFERAGAGWSAPVDVVLPTQPTVPQPTQLAWRGGDLILMAKLSATAAGVERFRSVTGTWQPDPWLALDQRAAFGNPLGTTADGVLLGFPQAQVAATITGQAKLYRVDDTGFVEGATLGFDDAALSSDGAFAVGGGHLLATTQAGARLLWFERETDGSYRRRPSLALDSASSLAAPLATSGSHALVTARHGRDFFGVQAFELGAHDWTAGELLALPADAVFTGSIAVDGDTAAISAARSLTSSQSRGVALIYTWSGAGWALSATLDGGLGCGSSAVLSGGRVAMFCGKLLRLFQRTGDAWGGMPAPALPDPADAIVRVLLSGDHIAVVTHDPREDRMVSDVFHWIEGHWHRELEVRDDRAVAGCSFGCSFGAAALAGDRLLVYRDATSLTAYHHADDHWVERAPVALPAAQRSPTSFVESAVLNDERAFVSVAADGDGIDPLAGAIYVLGGP